MDRGNMRLAVVGQRLDLSSYAGHVVCFDMDRAKVQKDVEAGELDFNEFCFFALTSFTVEKELSEDEVLEAKFIDKIARRVFAYIDSPNKGKGLSCRHLVFRFVVPSQVKFPYEAIYSNLMRFAKYYSIRRVTRDEVDMLQGALSNGQTKIEGARFENHTIPFHVSKRILKAGEFLGSLALLK